jgi:hypothetical protein
MVQSGGWAERGIQEVARRVFTPGEGAVVCCATEAQRSMG